MKYGTIDIMVNEIRNMKPVDNSKKQVKYDKHIKNCKKQICDECSRLLREQ